MRQSALILCASLIASTAQFQNPVLAEAKPAMLSRGEWQAKPPILSRMKRQVPKEIIIHHSSVKQQPHISLEQKLRGLQSYSQNKKPWGDSPYHYYIGVSGRIGEARDVAYAGDTNTRYSVKNRIQIVLEGHFDTEQPNAGQLAALRAVIAWLTARHKISGARITGHNDHASTDCPGRNLKRLLPQLRKSAAF